VTRKRRQRVLDVDERGRVVGFAPPMRQRAQGESIAGPVEDWIDANRDALATMERVARAIADAMLVPVELVLELLAKLKGLPMFLAVAYVLVQLTKREHRQLRGRRA
jgi:hypothetical protein